MRIAGLVVAAALALAGPTISTAHAADIRIICSNGFQAVMLELGPRFERTTGHRLMVSYGLAAVLGREIEDGAPFDLTILAPPQIDALIKLGKIAADSRTVLARSGMGVMVRAGAPKPDIATVEAFKRTMLNAKSIAFPPQGQSGII
jgi:molybdate transport system substrate-binding protein